MAIKCVVFCLFISININLAAYVRPKIIKDSEDITLEVGEDYNITCQGSKPLTWRYPAVWEQEKQQWTSFENNPSDVPHNNDYAYRSVLVIRNMSYPFVGYYTCSYENVANGDNDQIYLFVNDPVHLSVEDTYRIHYAAQHQETTIPCRPTNRDVEVELISYGKDKSKIVGKCDPSTLEDHFQTVYCFDKKKGFWTNDTISEYKLENRGRNEVECNFRKNSSTQNKTLKVYFEESRAFLPIPHIEDLSNNHTDVGQVLNLTCILQELSYGMSIMFQWETPRGTFRVPNGNTQVDKTKRKNGYLISNLHVLNTTMKDAGSYTCTVSDRQNHSSTSETYIMIHDTDSCFIEIREENNQRSITVEAGEKVQWILDVNGYPVPELIWIDNKGSVVKNDSMYETNQILNTAIFRIKNVSLENDGSYMPRGKVSRDLEASNCHNFEVILTVYDKPAICLDSRENCTREKNLFQKIYMLNEVVEIECKATGNPLPKINWLHKPCLEDGCKFVDVKPTREKNESKFVTTSFLRVNTTHEGLITCIASNIIGQDVSNLTYYILESREFLAIPHIQDHSNNHTVVGQVLNLTCTLQEISHNIVFHWKTPRGTFRVPNGNTQVDRTKRKNGYLTSNLHVLNTTVNDAGSYTCIVSDKQNHSSTSETYIMIHDTGSCFIEIREKNNKRSITVEAGDEVQWILEVNAHPVPEFIWIDNKGSVVKNDSMYETNQTLNTATFRIKNVSLENDGSYILRGKVSRDIKTSNCHNESNFEVILTVYDKPVICLDSREECQGEKNLFPKIYMLNEVVEIKCKTTGNPLPKINWLHKPCLEDGCNFVDVKPTREKNESNVATSFLRVDTTHEGLITCIASNSIGEDVSNLTYYISDIKDGFDIYNFGDETIVTTNNTTIEVIIAIGSTLTFTCAVSPKRSDYIEIFFNNKSLSDDYVKNYDGNDLHKTIISLHEAKSDNGGVYSCRIRNLFTQLYEYKNVTITLKDPERPKIWTTNLDKEVVIDFPNMPYKLYCNYSGIPKPNVEWSKDNAPITPSPRIIFNENQKILEFVKTEVSDEGVYRCQVSNIAGHTFKEAALKFKDKQNNVRKYFFLICNKCFFQISIQ